MSRLLPERTLAVHRKVSEDNLPDRIDIYRPSRTKATGGMVTASLGALRATYPCRMIPTAELRDVFRADGVEVDANWAIVVAISSDVRRGDHAAVKGKGWQRVVEIVGTSNPRTDATVRHVFAVDSK